MRGKKSYSSSMTLSMVWKHRKSCYSLGKVTLFSLTKLYVYLSINQLCSLLNFLYLDRVHDKTQCKQNQLIMYSSLMRNISHDQQKSLTNQSLTNNDTCMSLQSFFFPIQMHLCSRYVWALHNIFFYITIFPSSLDPSSLHQSYLHINWFIKINSFKKM